MVKVHVKVLMLAILLVLEFHGLVGSVSGYFFQSPAPLEVSNGADVNPSAVQASNGTLWVAWASSRSGQFQVYYKTYNGTGWTQPRNATGGPPRVKNIYPSLGQLQNGTMILVWSSNQTGQINLYAKTLRGTSWTRPATVTSGLFEDDSAKTVVGHDGTLWVVWVRVSFSPSCLSGVCRQVYYKTLTGNVWSQENQLTSDNTWNTDPNVMVAKDGTIRVVYSKWMSQLKSPTFNLFDRVFNGVQWSSDVQLTNINSGTFGDDYSDWAQDRNGTIWLFWSREFCLATCGGTGAIFQDKILYKSSFNGGLSWNPETQLTFGGNSTNTVDDIQPFAVQGTLQSYWTLWVFYSTDALNLGFDMFSIRTNPVYPVHDVDITTLIVSPGALVPGGITSISVTVSNPGDYLESVKLTVQATNASTFTIANVTGLFGIGSTFTYILTWNATSAPPGQYTVKAALAPAPGETTGAAIDNTQYRPLTVLAPASAQLCSQRRGCPV
jgi:hypothetical protein